MQYDAQKYDMMPGAEAIYKPGNEVGCLLVHGFAATPKEMMYLASYLSKLGYTVYAPRITHHGTHVADLDRTRPWDWYFSIEDAWQVLSNQCEYVIPIGFSMGGVLALSLAAKKQVDAVVSISAPYLLELPWWWHFREILKIFKKSIPVADELWDDDFAKNNRVCYPDNPLAGFLEGVKGLIDYPEFLPKVQVPALLMHGKNDAVVPMQCIDKIYKKLGSSQKNKIIIEGLNHHLICDTIRETVFPHISTFISQQVNKKAKPKYKIFGRK